MYQKIDPNNEVKNVNSPHYFSKVLDSTSDYLKFDPDEMKNLLSSLAIIQLNEKTIAAYEGLTKQLFLKFLSVRKISYNPIQQYIFGMLNSLKPIEQESLRELTDMKFRRETLLENKLLNDFCSIHIIDPLSFIRIVDFGDFLLYKQANSVFKDIPKEKVEEFFKLEIKPDELTKKVIDSFSNMNINSDEAKFMISLYQKCFNPNYDELRSFQFGQNVLQNNMQYIDISVKIKSLIDISFENIIDNGRNNNLETTTGWTR